MTAPSTTKAHARWLRRVSPLQRRSLTVRQSNSASCWSWRDVLGDAHLCQQRCASPSGREVKPHGFIQDWRRCVGTRQAMERNVEHRWPADPDANLETWRERRGRDEAKGRLYESSTIMLRKVMRGGKSTPRPCSKARDTSSDQNLDEG